MDARTAMARARTHLLLDHRFFGTLALRLRLIERPDIETAGVDGVHLFYSPSFVLSLQPDELKGLVAHEVMHCALLHHSRRGHRDHQRWNIACDYAINQILIDAGLKLPKTDCINAAYRSWSAERIYDTLPQPPPDGSGKSGGKGKSNQKGNQTQGKQAAPTAGPPEIPDYNGTGCVLDAPMPTQAEMVRHETDWQVAVQSAAQIAKAQGHLPGSLAELIADMTAPKIDWRVYMRRFIERTIPRDYTWARPNRRHVGRGLYLPSALLEGVGEIVVAVDTSGSVGRAELQQFYGELNAIQQDLRPVKTHLIYCDARVNEVVEYEPDDQIVFTAKGRGGTDFRPPFAYVEEHGIDPKALIYLTDLMGPFPDEAPYYPVLWVSTTESVAPFGETIQIKV